MQLKIQEINNLKANRGFVDTCMVKLANRWLYDKFDKEAVTEAISYFDRIYSTQLKNELSIVQELLKNYESSYIEFQRIIKQAQNDGDRLNPFAIENYKSKYNNLIKNMYYYTKYYDNDWNIKYLNRQIKMGLEEINNHSDTKPADFTSLLDIRY